ncbi:Wound-induced protein WIN2 [Linum grandiflorum]
MVVLVLFLIASTSTPTSAELRNHRCFEHRDGTRFRCGPGRCCSFFGYCGNTTYYCSLANCAFQCPPSPPLHVMFSINVTVVKVMRNEYYDHDQTADSLSRSCANSLKNLSLASLHKYEWASFHVNNNNTIASTCGRCLKLTNVESGVEAVVRVVHERAATTSTSTNTTEGVVELGTATFNKLLAKDDRDQISVKYNFESCD